MQRQSFLKLFFCVCIFCLTVTVEAQQKYGFEWIKKYQPYYKFKIVDKGIYRIDSLNLSFNGISLLNVDPKRLQIFRNGIEQAVYIKGEGDGIFNAVDFLEIYAEPNNGTTDTELYRSVAEQPHTFKSLITDTACYFLTILPDTTVLTGKRFMLFTDSNYSAYTPESKFEVTEIIAPQEDYYNGAFIPASEKYYISEYGDAESMTSYLIGLDQQRSFTIKTPAVSNLQNASVEIKLIGASDNLNVTTDNHHVRIYAASNGLNSMLLVDSTFKGYGEHIWFRTLNSAALRDSITFTIQVVNDLGVSSDFITISYIVLKYYKNNQSVNSREYLTLRDAISSSRSLIQFNNYQKSSPLIYDLTTNNKVLGTKTGGLFNALIPYSSLARSLVILDETEVRSFPSMKRTIFSLIDPAANYQFLIISHTLLKDVAVQYEAYRAKKYSTLLVYSEELFDTYFYGNPHPLAIRRFCEHLYKQQASKPQFLLLLGRGYQNNLIRNNRENYALNLVPAIGVPSSDNMFTNGFDLATGAPSISTGRIAASTNVEALNYLQKLIYYENNPDSIEQWRKNYLHLSGGDVLPLQIEFRNELEANAEKIRNKPIGGYVTSYGKTTTNSSSDTYKDIITKKLNKGVNMLTFYGHGSLTILDINFGSINDLQSNNRCAFYYFNGCNVGNANDVDPRGTGLFYAKEYICAPSKGAIGWLAHTNLTLTGYLENQIDALYTQLSSAGYGVPIGINLKNALVQISSANDEFSRSHALQILLQGDPAVVLYAPSLPDYKVADEDLFISPVNATVQNDSLAIGIIVSNLAKAVGDTITVYCTRTLPDNKTINYPGVQIIGPYYADTFYYQIKPLQKSEIGLNVFNLTINGDHKVNEINYGNNSATISYFLPGSGIQPLLPYNYAIVDNDIVSLLVQNNNLAATNVSYVFEIDTSLDFSLSSSYFDSVVINGPALASWNKVLAAKDLTVFYWRARLNVPLNEGGVWVTQSFTYIKNGGTGWRQSKYEQIKNVSSASFIEFNDFTKKIEFSSYELSLGIEDKRWNHSRMGVTIPYLLNAGVGTCISMGTVVLIFEPFQVDRPYELPNYPFNCAYVQANKMDYTSIRYYPFNTNVPAGQAELKRLIDSVPNGYIVAMFSRYATSIQNWSAATKSIFAAIGSYKVEHVQSDNTAWSVIGKKGDPLGSAAEDTMNYNNTLNDTSFTITKSFRLKGFIGDFTSAIIGPAKSYNDVKLDLYDGDPVRSGRWWWQIIGISKEGKDSVLIRNLTSLQIGLNMIDAKAFPYLKLQLFNVDSTYRTPLQISYWQVKYEPATDVTVDLNADFSFYKDLLDQGDTLKITLPVRNIGDSKFDSSLLSVQILDEGRLIQYQSVRKLAPLDVNQTVLIKEKIPTQNLSGKETLIIKVNEDKAVPEISFNNDFYSKEFNVKADKSSPFLDVTFDGQRILNGDIVSPTPLIRISSTDQNKFLLQKDTATFALYLRKPKQFDFERIYFSNPAIQFMPANDKQNKAILQYSPSGLTDGLYTLKVQATDASGNKAGGSEYAVDFNVINKTSITHFYPYPNPFTTQMRFVFTLTGSVMPEQLMVRIMTISGKVVREVRKEEFGAIHIGNNVSEFAWDGTDQYGDRLANGVYLYQVYTRIEGKDLENRVTKAKEEQSFFTGNTGKIYLMR